MAKPQLGKRLVRKLLLIYMALNFKQGCGRHVVNYGGVFGADMV